MLESNKIFVTIDQKIKSAGMDALITISLYTPILIKGKNSRTTRLNENK